MTFLLCPCRTSKKQNTQVSRRSLWPKSNIDYSQLYPTFTAILAHPKSTEIESLLDLQTLLQGWAYCVQNACALPMVVDNEADPWANHGLVPLGMWTNSTKSKAGDMFFQVQTLENPGQRNIRTALAIRNGWTESNAPLWNLFWRYDRRYMFAEKTLVWQLKNRVQNLNKLNKAPLAARMQACWATAGKRDDIMHIAPLTFDLPEEYPAFLEAFQQRGLTSKSNVWVMKPAGGQRGDGIELVTDPQQVSNLEKRHVVQVYIDRPLLVKGYKFDFRLYVAVLSWQPLEAYVCRRGLARFCKTPYTTDLSDKYAHLTNVSQQKYNPLPGPLNGPSAGELDVLKPFLAEQGHPWPKIWDNVKDCIVQMLTCQQDKFKLQPEAFEYLGVDILLDEDYRAWLIEVNTFPSLEGNVSVDLTFSIIHGVASLADPTPFDRHALATVVERRISEITSWGSDSDTDPTEQLNEDLYKILGGQLPRQHGTHVKEVADFDVLAPSSKHEEYKQYL